jgi:hypothetical protein
VLAARMKLYLLREGLVLARYAELYRLWGLGWSYNFLCGVKLYCTCTFLALLYFVLSRTKVHLKSTTHYISKYNVSKNTLLFIPYIFVLMLLGFFYLYLLKESLPVHAYQAAHVRGGFVSEKGYFKP